MSTEGRSSTTLLMREISVIGEKQAEKAIAFYDNGSVLSFISQNLARKLQLERIGLEVLYIGTILSSNYVPILANKYRMKVMLGDGTFIDL